MKWRPYILEFTQPFEGGYRYLDRCGEFMFLAEKQFDFVPGEGKPTGAKLELPESGISASLNTKELKVRQEQSDDNGELFLSACHNLSKLAHDTLQPRRISQNCFGSKVYSQTASAEVALKTTLNFGSKYHVELGKLIGMSPANKSLNYTFSSGSLLLNVLARAVTFDSVTTKKVTPSFHASAEQVRTAERINKKADRFNRDYSYGILLEVDLTEFDPPEGKLAALYSELQKLEIQLKHVLLEQT